MDRPLNIAHCVESYAPSIGGMAEVVKQLSERLVRMGHRVTVYTSHHPDRGPSEMNGVSIRSYRASGNAVQGLQGDVAGYKRALGEAKHDVITFFAAQQWATDAMLPELGTVVAKKVFVPTGFSALYDPAWAAYYRQMPAWLKAMDMNVFHSENYQDVQFAKAHDVPRRMLIPNGAGEEEFQGTPTDPRAKLGIEPTDKLIVHIGSYTGIKGHKEAIRMYLAARTKDTVLLLVGSGNKALERIFHHHWRYLLDRWKAKWRKKRILFVEMDRERTVSALRGADLFLFPSNLECSPIVLFESMAAGVPFLASTAGNAEEIAAWSGGGWTIPPKRTEPPMVFPNVRIGAERLEALLHDPSALQQAGADGHRAWKERFTWGHIARRYEALYHQLVQ